VAVAQECKNQFDEIKKGKKHRYVVFYIEDEKMIKVECVGDRDASYDSFLNDLMKGGEGECRYGLYDFEYEHQCQGTTEVSKKQKLFLMSWCPDTARIKKKMLYSSSFDALKKALVGVHKYIQATDAAEASAESVEEKLKSLIALKTKFKPSRAKYHQIFLDFFYYSNLTLKMMKRQISLFFNQCCSHLFFLVLLSSVSV